MNLGEERRVAQKLLEGKRMGAGKISDWASGQLRFACASSVVPTSIWDEVLGLSFSLSAPNGLTETLSDC